MIGILVHGDNHFVVRGLTTVAHKHRVNLSSKVYLLTRSGSLN